MRIQRLPKDGEANVALCDGVVGLTLGIVTLVVVVCLVWFQPRMTGDTFMYTAAGHDVLAGKLGQPDEWSFTATDRVWINQSWGTGLLFYFAHSLMGYTGIVVLKAIMIAILAVALVLVARQMGAGFTISMLVSASGLEGLRHFIDMRANLVGIMMVSILLWMLYWSRKNPHRIWLAVVLLMVWAHMHGSFIFGLGAIGLWAVTTYAVRLYRGASRKSLVKCWPMLAAIVLGVVLCAVTSPFGIKNLSQPFTLLGKVDGQDWPEPATEMVPVFVSDQDSLGLPQFFAMLGLVGAPAVTWVCMCWASNRPIWREMDVGRAIALTFSLCLFTISVLMAFKARRFIPIAVVTAVPLAAMEFQWLLSHRWLAWPTAIITPLLLCIEPCMRFSLRAWKISRLTSGQEALAIDHRHYLSVLLLVMLMMPLVVVLVMRTGGSKWSYLTRKLSLWRRLVEWCADKRRFVWPTRFLTVVLLMALVGMRLPTIQRHYRPDSPRYPSHTLFQRMIIFSNFPSDAATFLNENNVTGQVFNDRRWEGFLRLHCPQLKLFFGGRSRQVYSPTTALRSLRIRNGLDINQLPRFGVHLMVLDANPRRDTLVRRLMFTRWSPWAPIYFDGRTMVLVSRDVEETRGLIDQAAAGRLKYPDLASRKLSRACCLFADAVSASIEETKDAAIKANLEFPTPQIYQFLFQWTQFQKQSQEWRWLADYLESELRRLEDVDYHVADGCQVLYSRWTAAYLLEIICRQMNRDKRAAFWSGYSTQVKRVVDAIWTGSAEPKIDPLPRRQVRDR